MYVNQSLFDYIFYIFIEVMTLHKEVSYKSVNYDI